MKVALIILIAGMATACESGDKIRPTNDPCIFLLDFAPRCQAAGKTAICTTKPPVLARSQSIECVKDKS